MADKNFVLTGIVACGLALAGCSASGGGSGAGTAPPADCGAAALQGRVGQPVSGTTAQTLRVGGEPAASRGNVRVVAPGQAVTMDFNPDRLTIETDAAGNLVRAQCT